MYRFGIVFACLHTLFNNFLLCLQINIKISLHRSCDFDYDVSDKLLLLLLQLFLRIHLFHRLNLNRALFLVVEEWLNSYCHLFNSLLLLSVVIVKIALVLAHFLFHLVEDLVSEIVVGVYFLLQPTNFRHQKLSNLLNFLFKIFNSFTRFFGHSLIHSSHLLAFNFFLWNWSVEFSVSWWSWLPWQHNAFLSIIL